MTCTHDITYPPLTHRGGDFFRRQAAGEHPKQLNYSRAFGGKDLKMFGLSVEPDISHFEITPEGTRRPFHDRKVNQTKNYHLRY